MFTIKEWPELSYTVAWIDGGFEVLADQPAGEKYEAGIKAEVELAYAAELAQARYMPTAGMIEYFTAQRLKIKMPIPEMESEEGVIY